MKPPHTKVPLTVDQRAMAPRNGGPLTSSLLWRNPSPDVPNAPERP